MSFATYRSFLPDPERFRRYAVRPEPTHLRLRPHRADPAAVVADLEELGFELQPVPGLDDVRLVREEPISAGNTLRHWLGHFYIQQAVTAVAAPALGALPGERVLDMAAAPGGKTIHLSDRMEDRGPLVASEISEKRIRGLLGNLYRTAVSNTVVLSGDARRLGGEALFDRVLLDAPCSGEGNLRKRAGALDPADEGYLQHLVGLQRGLLRRALELVRPGGRVLYVTCTFNPAENEGIVSHVLEEWDGEVEFEEIPLEVPHAPGLTSWAGERYRPGIEAAWRLYPYHLDSGGLFLCRLRRRGDPGRTTGWRALPPAFPDDRAPEEATSMVDEGVRQLAERYGVSEGSLEGIRWITRGDSAWATGAQSWAPALWDDDRVRVVSVGLRGMKEDPRTGLRPTNDLLQWLDRGIGARRVSPPRNRWDALLRREPFEVAGLDDGFAALVLGGHVVGRGIVRGGRLRHEVAKARAHRLRDVLAAEAQARCAEVP